MRAEGQFWAYPLTPNANHSPNESQCSISLQLTNSFPHGRYSTKCICCAQSARKHKLHQGKKSTHCTWAPEVRAPTNSLFTRLNIIFKIYVMHVAWKSFRALYSFSFNLYLTGTPCTGKLKDCERNLNHAVFPTKDWVSWKTCFQVSCFLAASLWILILCSGQSWRLQRSDAVMGTDHSMTLGTWWLLPHHISQGKDTKCPSAAGRQKNSGCILNWLFFPTQAHSEAVPEREHGSSKLI